MPLVWVLNHVRLRQAVEFAEAVELTDSHLAGYPFRRVTIEDELAGARLEGEFRAGGWRVDREVTMLHARPRDREVDSDEVIEPGSEEMLELLTRWYREEFGSDPEVERQLARCWERQWATRDTTFLGMRGQGGQLAAMTTLYSDGITAQVEDVYTTPQERGRGFARALVSRALDLAVSRGHELTFIVADDQDWPQQLYGRLGFEAAGRTWTFHRELGGRAAD